MNYRFCFLDHRDHVIRSEQCELKDDDAACDRAKGYFKSQSPEAVEVWIDHRFICRVSDAGLQRAALP
jgi:hypothetical protein